MQWNVINENCIIGHLPEFEALLAADGLLMLEEKEEFYARIYGQELMSTWKKRYRFLFETTNSIKELGIVGVMEYLSDFELNDFTIEKLRDRLVGCPVEWLIHTYLRWNKHVAITQEKVKEALANEESFTNFYEMIESDCPNFFGVSAFFNEFRRYLSEYFSLVKDMQNDFFFKEINSFSDELNSKILEIENGIKNIDPLEYSQSIMGKEFYNRGPYEKFYFIPCIFSTYRVIRYFIEDSKFHKSQLKQQIMFISLRKADNTQDKIVAALKALSDKTRYQILSLLSQKGPIHGREIAKNLSIAPSTVSHHMELLSSSGLITEEQVKTAKYYGINKIRVQELFDDMKKDIKLSE